MPRSEAPGPEDADLADDPADSEATESEAGSDDPFEAMVFAALDALPDVFRDRLGSVAVVIEDEPTPAQLASVGAWGLLGLYTGLPRTAWGAGNAALANKITIFRGPHLRQFPDLEALRLGVAETVRHEVAHHFGISDARLEELARERGER
jgi:predicted Zn-dependent protease with MMP-like domain